MELTYLADPAHGWLVLPPDVAATLGITQDDLTCYSYVSRDGILYAEEDCDAAVVLAAHLRKFGTEPLIRAITVDGEAPCRAMRACRASRPRFREDMLYLDLARKASA